MQALSLVVIKLEILARSGSSFEAGKTLKSTKSVLHKTFGDFEKVSFYLNSYLFSFYIPPTPPPRNFSLPQKKVSNFVKTFLQSFLLDGKVRQIFREKETKIHLRKFLQLITMPNFVLDDAMNT